jgi:hypothetical protein
VAYDPWVELLGSVVTIAARDAERGNRAAAAWLADVQGALAPHRPRAWGAPPPRPAPPPIAERRAAAIAALRGGDPPAEVARRFGFSPQSASRWRGRLRAEGAAAD